MAEDNKWKVTHFVPVPTWKKSFYFWPVLLRLILFSLVAQLSEMLSNFDLILMTQEEIVSTLFLRSP